MKKTNVVSIMMILILLVNICSVSAKTGDVNGSALHTDIVAYINHYAISSYAINGQSCVVAEDLINYGFDVQWNEVNRSLYIKRNNSSLIHEQYIAKNGSSGTHYANTYETDISVFTENRQLTAYAINGYTMIPLEQLDLFGEIYWYDEERTLKLWITGLQVRNQAQKVAGYSKNNPVEYSETVYITPTGKRYHYSESCSGKNRMETNIDKAKSSGYTPCKKCAI